MPGGPALGAAVAPCEWAGLSGLLLLGGEEQQQQLLRIIFIVTFKKIQLSWDWIYSKVLNS